MKRVSVLVWLCVACAPQSTAVQCADGRTCPEGTECADAFGLCVDPAQLDVCEGVATRERCTLPGGGDGTCQLPGCTEDDQREACMQVLCLSAGCGNGRLDHPEDEVCDDGNSVNGDGCSGNCQSVEACRNAVLDVGTGETCDDGNARDHDGCSSACQSETARWVEVSEPGPLSQMRAVYDAARDRVVMFGGKAPGGSGVAVATTSEWAGLWHADIEAALPVPRQIDTSTQGCCASFAMAYDHALRRTVMVGGTINNVSVPEVWSWDGQRWAQLADMPVALSDHAMAYDAKRKRIVLFGGRAITSGETSVLDETWELDGTTWTKVTTPTTPSARYRSGMTYDPARGVIVLYGGTGSDSFQIDDLWEYDGTWTQRAFTVGQISTILHPQLAFERRTGRVVVVGNAGDNTLRMLLWDGTALTEFEGAMPVAGGPVAESTVRRGMVVVENGNDNLMMYGGQHPSASGDRLLTTRLTWFFDGTSWFDVPTPPPAYGAPMVTKLDEGAVVRFGGRLVNQSSQADYTTPSNDTWELTRLGWRRFATGNPPAVLDPAMAYDSQRNEVVLFGGATANASPTPPTTRDTLWIRRGETWTQVTKAGTWPPARRYHSMIYDSARAEVVMFGGHSSDRDTWTWDGSAWTQHVLASSPAARFAPAFGYDPVNRVGVLFGGGLDSFNNARSDTWIWDGMQWTDVTAQLSSSPAARYSGTLTWDPARQSLILVQDTHPFNVGVLGQFLDTWEWKTAPTSPPSGTWKRISTPRTPPQHGFAGVFTTPDGSGVSMFHGLGFLGAVQRDHWQLRLDATSAQDTCWNPFDGDGDARTGCTAETGDPDCWRVCTPDCEPGVACPAVQESCGDGTCSAIETCYTCPQDCASTCPMRCGDFICDAGEACAGDCP